MYRDLISSIEAARRLGVDPRTVRRYIADGKLTGYRVGERLVKVDPADVDQLIQPISPQRDDSGDAS